MDFNKSKYIKYKNKYLKLKNKDMLNGGSDISHFECKSNVNEEIILTLFLQLLIEYEVMFDYMQKKDSGIFLNQNPNPFEIAIAKSNQNQNKTYNSTNYLESNAIKDNIFLPIFKFLNYNSGSVNTLLNSKEQIIETIKIISNYCSIDIKNKCKKYREELFCNEQLIKKICIEKLFDSKKSFYDSRNYSISVMLNTMFGTYDNWKHSPILIYTTNEDGIIDGHIFILYKYEKGCLEAISIQSSLKLLIESNCLSIKQGISKKLFDYVFDKIVPLYKSANYIYAHAWEIMSNILVHKYNFYTVTYDDYDNYYINNKTIDEERIEVNSIEYALLRDLKDNASSHYNSMYIFTVKKI
jgi:hypothetical protein